MASHKHSQVAIQLDHVTKFYGQTRALDNISIHLPAGKIIGLVGPNGAGKTTLIKLLASLMQPDSGTIRVHNLDLQQRIMQVRALTGYLAQKPLFDNWMHVRNVMELSARLSGARPINIDDVLRTCGLSDLDERRVDSLSGGELQRLGIATAVIHEPSIVILDEPAASLDPRGRHDMLELIRSLKQAGRTIIFSSHILADVERVADYLVLMDYGQVIKSGARSHVLGSKDLESVFLGVTA